MTPQMRARVIPVMTSGSRSLLTEVCSWIVVFGICAIAIVHFDEVKGLTASALGLEPPLNAASVGEPQEQNPRADDRDGSVVELRSGPGGHYHAEAEINGRDIEVMVDTGATMVVLTWEDAERAGLFMRESDFTHRASTANGAARVAPVTLDNVSIGDITVRDVRAMVSERGALGVSLLGMSFLGRIERVDMRQGTLILQN